MELTVAFYLICKQPILIKFIIWSFLLGLYCIDYTSLVANNDTFLQPLFTICLIYIIFHFIINLSFFIFDILVGLEYIKQIYIIMYFLVFFAISIIMDFTTFLISLILYCAPKSVIDDSFVGVTTNYKSILAFSVVLYSLYIILVIYIIIRDIRYNFRPIDIP